MHLVPITQTKSLADYAEVIGEKRYEGLRTLAKAAKGRSMLHINATAYGGGVAEILQKAITAVPAIAPRTDGRIKRVDAAKDQNPCK